MKRVIAYMRVSTEGQTQGQGFDLQWRQIEAFTKERGYKVIRKFRDALSGMGEDSLRKRPGLQAAIKYAKDNNWMIIVASYDRLSRGEESIVAHDSCTWNLAELCWIASRTADCNEIGTIGGAV